MCTKIWALTGEKLCNHSSGRQRQSCTKYRKSRRLILQKFVVWFLFVTLFYTCTYTLVILPVIFINICLRFWTCCFICKWVSFFCFSGSEKASQRERLWKSTNGENREICSRVCTCITVYIYCCTMLNLSSRQLSPLYEF